MILFIVYRALVGFFHPGEFLMITHSFFSQSLTVQDGGTGKKSESKMNTNLYLWQERLHLDVYDPTLKLEMKRITDKNDIK